MAKTKQIGMTPFDAAEYLQDEASIAAFLNASREMNDPAVLLNALATVARARSMTELAEASGLGRESLYKALRPGAQPRYETVLRVMDALGVEMIFQARRSAPEAKRKAVKAASPTRTKKATMEATSSKPQPGVVARSRRKGTGSMTARRASR